ncbi:DUF4269 domain-containing protein [Hymenobacter cellulosivorans]|uniref:DUF4269 domain-containing protein n=1 Tax=Hymenobacter cellulosivorans TaxID=2932249 RepID=A0ABY4F445_9BACT|nr:DUF4269 domain-containing protein [Hymenobacter cellulosivorans]UOQ50837.1 DUF4269 domain-containing protein [Hymenobacter cellulosivorans]
MAQPKPGAGTPYMLLGSTPDWKNPQYLLAGNSRQQRAYVVLQELGIWSVLNEFDPVLAGTVPLAIDLPDSDLDIICEVRPEAQGQFRALLEQHYGRLPEYALRQHLVGGQESIVCGFRAAGVAVEVFGQNLPTARQNAVRHLVIEHAILAAGGEAWRVAVKQLKQQGIKTEPAFAQLLGLTGNPYEALLEVESWSAAALRERLMRCSLLPNE